MVQLDNFNSKIVKMKKRLVKVGTESLNQLAAVVLDGRTVL